MKKMGWFVRGHSISLEIAPFDDTHIHCESHSGKASLNYMHGKTQREPAHHSVVLDCEFVPLHNTCQSLPAVCYYNVHAVRLTVSSSAKI